MISYNKERNAWDFSAATDDERVVLTELGESIWATSMATALAKKWVEEEKAQFEEAQRHLPDPPDNVVALGPKKAH